jgi:hypothetical protein
MTDTHATTGEDRSSRAPASSRFEWRVFGRQLERPAARIAAEAKWQGRDSGTALYLLGRRRDRNVKVRGGTVDVKALREVRGGLQRWAPVAHEPLPVSGAWVREALADHLGLEKIAAPGDDYSLDALIGEILDPGGIETMRLTKDRERYRIGSLRAESARVWLRRRRFETAAIESDDPDVVSSWLAPLGLDRWPNRSYVEFIEAFREKSEPREKETEHPEETTELGGPSPWAGR